MTNDHLLVLRTNEYAVPSRDVQLGIQSPMAIDRNGLPNEFHSRRLRHGQKDIQSTGMEDDI